MSDLIDRQAAIMGLIFSDGTRNLTCGQMAKILNAIKALPSAQPEIIHCRDCKWHNGELDQCNAQICASMCGEDFCSKAERREDG